MAKQPDSEKTKRDNCIPESTLPLNSDASLPQEEASVENRYAFLATTATEITLCQYMAPLLHSKLMEDNYIKDLLQAREKAEESDRLKSAFLANMSHEIRTPMNGILGFADLLKEPDLSGEEQQQYIRIIQQSGKRMLNIINDIVNISTIEAGLIKLNFQETDISKQIEFIYTFFKPEAGAKGLKLVINNTLTEKDTILKTDGEKVYAILTNLVKNALKYTHKGSIELRCEAEVKEDGTPQLIFKVKDTGIGIAKDRQKAIFDRFVQADIEDRMAYQGAGLGLAISKAYAEMLGGELWVESDEGIGSTFFFTLPYSTNTATTSPVWQEYPHTHTGLRPLKILIVEDDEISEQLIAYVVKSISKQLLKARNGVEAIELCRNHPDIDVVLMDIRMPAMNGYEATKHIRQFNKDLIIIAQTAYGLVGDRENALAAGCNDYISKPINKTELLEILQKHLN